MPGPGVTASTRAARKKATDGSMELVALRGNRRSPPVARQLTALAHGQHQADEPRRVEQNSGGQDESKLADEHRAQEENRRTSHVRGSHAQRHGLTESPPHHACRRERQQAFDCSHAAQEQGQLGLDGLTRTGTGQAGDDRGCNRADHESSAKNRDLGRALTGAGASCRRHHGRTGRCMLGLSAFGAVVRRSTRVCLGLKAPQSGEIAKDCCTHDGM